MIVEETATCNLCSVLSRQPCPWSEIRHHHPPYPTITPSTTADRSSTMFFQRCAICMPTFLLFCCADTSASASSAQRTYCLYTTIYTIITTSTNGQERLEFKLLHTRSPMFAVGCLKYYNKPCRLSFGSVAASMAALRCKNPARFGTPCGLKLDLALSKSICSTCTSYE